MVRTIADMQGSLHSSSRWQKAVYADQEIAEYRNNPFIEGLPPIADDEAALDGMQVVVRASNAERGLPSHMRRHLIARIRNLHQPFEPHIELFHTVNVMIRQGYVKRNPLDKRYVREMTAIIGEIERAAKEKRPPKVAIGSYTAASGSLLGLSGVGKTRAIDRVLDALGPQVLEHPELSGPLGMTMQVVYLKVTCSEGSVRSLCSDCISALDTLLGTDYARLHCTRAASADTLRAALARLAWLHGLGLIVVDEVNNLLNAKGGAAASVKNYFKVLADIVGVPVLVVGTEDATAVLADFQSGRRHAGIPFMLPLPLYHVVEAERPGLPATRVIDPHFRFICEGLFDAQFVQNPIALDDDLIVILHGLSFGILGVLVPLFMATQQRSLATGEERLSAALFKQVYRDSFGLLHVHLQKLQSDKVKLDRKRFEADLQTIYTQYAEVDEEALDAAPIPPPPEIVKAPVPKPTKSRRRGKEASRCLLVRVVQEGMEEQTTAWQALLKSGHVRPLGAEVVS